MSEADDLTYVREFHAIRQPGSGWQAEAWSWDYGMESEYVKTWEEVPAALSRCVQRITETAHRRCRSLREALGAIAALKGHKKLSPPIPGEDFDP